MIQRTRVPSFMLSFARRLKRWFAHDGDVDESLVVEVQLPTSGVYPHFLGSRPDRRPELLCGLLHLLLVGRGLVRQAPENDDFLLGHPDSDSALKGELARSG